MADVLFHIEISTLANKHTLRRLPALPKGFVWVWGTTKPQLKDLNLKVHKCFNRNFVWFYMLELTEIESKIRAEDYDRLSIYGWLNRKRRQD